MSQEAKQICNSSPKCPHVDGPAHSRTWNDVSCPFEFRKPLVKVLQNRKNLSKSWTPLKGKSAGTSNHHHDNNDGRNRDDVFSRDGDALRHYVNKLTLSGDISIRRHHSSSVP